MIYDEIRKICIFFEKHHVLKEDNKELEKEAVLYTPSSKFFRTKQ